MEQRTLRSRMLLGEAAMEKLKESHVAVFGLGGVGAWCAEALARAGVGRLTLIDRDTVGESNINRQLIALSSTLGQEKARVMAARIEDINPAIVSRPIVGTYRAEDRERFFADYDYVVDAIDLVSCKLDLIQTAHQRNIPIISALGTGNKVNAELLCVSDISKTEGCPLARVIRRELRARGIQHHKVVFSPEPAHSVHDFGEMPDPGRRSIPASVMWVPATAGLLMASAVIEDLVGGF